ncbi:MAG: UDP-N-acetylmuramoyl-L-alanine--D-glutamate ligase [Clostridia bacterium]|nr:UDP-N-acetylmuramoyl-L-alanine--D-glutamate ligase [Clostridia bacterium]
MNFLKTAKDLQNVTATVVGLGISNLPLIDFLLAHGARVTARDGKEREALGELPRRLEEKGVPLFCGASYLQGIDERLVFRTPGLRPDHPALLEAVKNGSVLTSEMELFLALTKATVIGITGSDGKTTTTTLTGLFLQEECRKKGAGRVFVGGNIGEPLLPYVEEMTADDYAVVELSSFQLQTVKRSADIAAVTNLSENHLNWHVDMAEYVRAKTNIFAHPQNRRVVLNAENAESMALRAQITQPVTLFSSKKTGYAELLLYLREGDGAVFAKDGQICYSDGKTDEVLLEISEIRLPGVHNLENYMTALALTHGEVGTDSILAVARKFTGVRHRLEPVRELDGVRYYNSSIDSSPSRTAAALSALAPEKPIVICGGADKGCSFEPLAEVLCKHAKAVILTGQTAPKIREVLNACPEVQSGTLPILENADFQGAVELARTTAREGDIVLLSPACTSFDAFRNFEERGDTFCQIVRAFV